MTNRVIPLPLEHDQLFQGKRGEEIPYHRMYSKEYCVPAVILYKPEEISLLQEASVAIDQIFQKGLRFVQRHLPDPILINQLGIHPKLIPCVRMEVPFHGVSRQDWIINSSGMKLIENNTDTPTGIPETSFLAGSILDEFTEYRNPSKKMSEQIQQAFISLIEFYRSCGFQGEIVFSCYDCHEEDRCNTLYLMKQVQEAGYPVTFVPLEQLEIRANDGLFYKEKKIDIWYRLYPLEYLVHDTDEDGFPTGEAILSLIEQRKLALINPPQSVITQSKGFMALLWSLYEKNEQIAQWWGLKSTVFTEKECEIIRRYMLPTYFDPDFFLKNKIAWVSKAWFGREGKGTQLYNNEGKPEVVQWEHQVEEEEDIETKAYYEDQPRVFQQRVPLEEIYLPTEQGTFHGYLLTGAFVIGGTFAGLLPRIGGKITGNLAYYAPAGIIDKHSLKSTIRR